MEERATVLVVDDELGSREALRFTLKPMFDVYTSENGQEALGFIRKKPVDIVTLDLKMPGMNGIEVLKEIKRLDPDIQVIIITAYATVESCQEAIRWGVFNYINKPFHPVDIISSVQKSIERRKLNKSLKTFIRKVTETDSLNHLVTQFIQGGFIKQGNSLMDFVRVLVGTIEKRDPYTWGHSERVCSCSSIFVEKLDISDDEKAQIQLAAYLHDVGKIGLDDSYMRKPGKLTKLEWIMMKKHPEIAIEILEPLTLSPGTISVIKHHHEHYNGKGYPDGLVKNKIPLGARIISLCDAYDAMRSDRPYRNAMSKTQTLSEIERCSGSQFDPDLVGIFEEAVEHDE